MGLFDCMCELARQTIRNNQFLADGSLNPARIRPRDAGFGAADRALSMRTVQLQLRFRF
jgi:hypothetical protein